MRLFAIFSLLFSTCSLACDTDVVINEGSSISFCSGTNTTVSASSGFVNYSWTGPQNFSTPTISPNISGTYVVQATDALGCISSDTITVTVFNAPFGVINSSEGSILCPGEGTVLSLSQGFSSYLWNTGSTLAILQVNNPGIYSVQVTDANGCISNTSIVISSPNFQMSASSTTVCTGGTVVLSASGASSYNWSNGAVTQSIQVSPSETTVYSVEMIAGNCTNTLEQEITVVDVVESNIEDTVYLAKGDAVFLNGPEGYTTYSWSPSTSISSTNTQGTNFFGDNSTTYTITSSISANCQRVDTIHVIVLDLEIPTGFSPNYDQVNDLFVIPGIEYLNAEIVIWNRWGERVFESERYMNDWDGTCQTSLCIGNGPLPEGTYFYEITAKKILFKGFTTLKR